MHGVPFSLVPRPTVKVVVTCSQASEYIKGHGVQFSILVSTKYSVVIKMIKTFRNVTVAFDEMKVHEDLVFEKSGKVVGFVDTGEINNKLRSLEQSCKGVEHDEIATHVLTLMVRGIFMKLQFPYAQFPTTGEGINVAACCCRSHTVS